MGSISRRAVSDTLHAIVVNTICLSAAARAFMSFAWKLYVYFYLSFIFLNIFYDYIFQSEQFCYIALD